MVLVRQNEGFVENGWVVSANGSGHTDTHTDTPGTSP